MKDTLKLMHYEVRDTLAHDCGVIKALTDL